MTIVAVFIIGAPATTGVAYATPAKSAQISGTMTANVLVTSIRNAGTKVIWTATDTGSTAGDLVSSMAGNAIFVVDASGFSGAGVQTLTGAMCGKSGTLKAIMFENGSLASGAADGTLTILGGTGGFRDLHGCLAFHLSYDSGTDTWTGTYSGSVTFR